MFFLHLLKLKDEFQHEKSEIITLKIVIEMCDHLKNAGEKQIDFHNFVSKLAGSRD